MIGEPKAAKKSGVALSLPLDRAGKAKRRRHFSRALTFRRKKRCGALLPTAVQRFLSPQAKLVVVTGATQDCAL